MARDWEPDRYLTFADERGRPFFDLVARVGAQSPARVVDLGCGPGNLTETLAERWPAAAVLGLDSSPEMIASAQRIGGRVDYRVESVESWASATGDSVDVVVSNAALQWIPKHLDLLPAIVERVSPGGWLAFQVPGNFDEPSHRIRAEIAGRSPYAEQVDGIAHPSSHDAATYLRVLQGLGCSVDAWETTYLHVLTREQYGDDPVFTWVSGTGARPTLQALDAETRPLFEAEFKARLREAYPDDGHGVVLPFRRIFVVARPAVHGR